MSDESENKLENFNWWWWIQSSSRQPSSFCISGAARLSWFKTHL